MRSNPAHQLYFIFQSESILRSDLTIWTSYPWWLSLPPYDEMFCKDLMVFNGRLLIFEERNHMDFEELLLFDFKGKSEHFAKYLTQTPVVSNDMPFANFMFSTRNYIVLCSMDKETGCAITKEKSLSEKKNFFQNRCTFSDNLRIFISTSTEKNIVLSHYIYQGHARSKILERSNKITSEKFSQIWASNTSSENQKKSFL